MREFRSMEQSQTEHAETCFRRKFCRINEAIGNLVLIAVKAELIRVIKEVSVELGLVCVYLVGGNPWVIRWQARRVAKHHVVLEGLVLEIDFRIKTRCHELLSDLELTRFYWFGWTFAVCRVRCDAIITIYLLRYAALIHNHRESRPVQFFIRIYPNGQVGQLWADPICVSELCFEEVLLWVERLIGYLIRVHLVTSDWLNPRILQAEGAII